MAAEHISRKSENILNTETRRLTLKLEMTENELNDKKISWETEKSQLEKRVADMEREKIVKETREYEYQEKYKKSKEEYEDLKRNYEKLLNHAKEKEINYENKIEEYKRKIEQKFENVKTEHSTKIIDYEKEKSTILSEMNSLKKENENFKEKINISDKISYENQDLNKKNKKLTQKIEDLQENNSQAIASMKLNYEMKIREV